MTATERNTQAAEFAVQMLAQAVAWPDGTKLPKAEFVEAMKTIVLKLTGDTHA